MLSFAFAPGLLLLLTLIPILVFYFLRFRFKKQVTPSTYIWKRVISTTERGRRPRRRSILLLVLQVLAAILASFTIAQPSVVRQRLLPPGTVFLLDNSASMRAKDDLKTSRFSLAVERCREAMQALPQGTPSAVFLCSDQARQLKGTLTGEQAGFADFNEAAVAESLRAWLAATEGDWSAVLYTDGGLDLEGREIGSVFSGQFSSEIVGSSFEDVGLGSLRAEDASRFSLQVTNSGSVNKPVDVTVSADSGEGTFSRLVASLHYDAAPGNHRVEIPAKSAITPGLYRASLAGGDMLAEDDQCYYAVNESRPLRILVVGSLNPFLQSVLTLNGISASSVAQWSDDIPAASWDVVVASDAAVPDSLGTAVMAFGTVPVGAPVRPSDSVSGELGTLGMSVQDAQDPLLRYVDWGSIHVLDAVSYRVPPGIRILASVGGEPAILYWQNDSFPRLLIGPALEKGELGISPAFPVLFRNFLRGLSPQTDNALAYTLRVGSPTRISAARELEFAGLEGLTVLREGPQLVLQSSAPGFGRWHDARGTGFIAANIPAGESNVAPRQIFSATPSRVLAQTSSVADIPLSPWLVLATLLILVGEWFAWRGRSVRKEERRAMD